MKTTTQTTAAMRIKQHHFKPLTGIPRARATVATGEDGQAPTVNVFVHAIDVHDMPTLAFSLRLSPEGARALAAELLKHAGASA